MQKNHRVAGMLGLLAVLTLAPGSSAADGGEAAVGSMQAADRTASGSKVSITVGDAGLSALTYGGTRFIAQPENGGLSLFAGPVLQRANGTTYGAADKPAKTDVEPAKQTVTLIYAWGTLRAFYAAAGERLNISLSVHNTTPDTLTGLAVKVLEPTFPAVPQCTEMDAGMFGQGGARHPLDQYPVTATPRSAAPLIFMEFGGDALAFCSDNPAAPLSLTVPYTTNKPDKTRYPFVAVLPEIAPGKTVTFPVSLRFGHGAAVTDLAGDAIKRYAAAFPFRVRWTDHRPIGTLFLSSAGNHSAANPRGWFNNDARVDVNTPEGLARFRKQLLEYADGSIKILKEMNAQGMITWDPEGQEYSWAVYYGDPRLTGRLAPETAFKDSAVMACIDEYFKKFRDAGLRVGVCLRPQEIRFANGAPRQTDSPDPAKTLLSKLAYARKRWGCTLFYMDSTVDSKGGALDADVIRQVSEANPDVLLMPENENLRYFAYSAPLNSFQHHGVASTPPGARLVYPRAFSVLLAGEGDLNGRRAELVAAVRRGDILLFHGWWPNPNNAIIKSLYEEAARPGSKPP